MPLRERVFARFHPVATGALRLDPEAADAFASHLASANEGIHVITQLCTGPNALKSGTLDVMLERWFRLLPEYEFPCRVLAGKPGPSMNLPSIEPSRGSLLHSRVVGVCLSQRRCTEPDASVVATHLREAAGPFWIFAQHSASTERRSQRDLCSLLRGVLGQPLEHALQASRLYLAFGEA